MAGDRISRAEAEKRAREYRARMIVLDELRRVRVVAPSLVQREEFCGGTPPHIPTRYRNGKDVPTGECEQFVCDCGGELFKAFWVNDHEGDIRCEKCGRWHILHDG